MKDLRKIKKWKTKSEQKGSDLQEGCVTGPTSVTCFGGQSASDGDASYLSGNPYKCRIFDINFVNFGVK